MFPPSTSKPLNSRLSAGSVGFFHLSCILWKQSFFEHQYLVFQSLSAEMLLTVLQVLVHQPAKHYLKVYVDQWEYENNIPDIQVELYCYT